MQEMTDTFIIGCLTPGFYHSRVTIFDGQSGLPGVMLDHLDNGVFTHPAIGNMAAGEHHAIDHGPIKPLRGIARPLKCTHQALVFLFSQMGPFMLAIHLIEFFFVPWRGYWNSFAHQVTPF